MAKCPIGVSESLGTAEKPVIYSPRVQNGRGKVDEWVIPKCMKCEIGQLVPLSDYGGQGASVHYKAWVCTNPDCRFNLKIRNGDVYANEPVVNLHHEPRR